MQRRQLLGMLGAAAAGLAGCIDRDQPTQTSPTDTPTDTTPDGTPTRTPRTGEAGIGTIVDVGFGNIRIEQADAQQSIVLVADDGTKQVINDQTRQYLLFRINLDNIENTEASVAASTLRANTTYTVNNTTYEPFQEQYESTSYADDTNEMTLVVPAPRPLPDDADAGTLTYENGDVSVQWDVAAMVTMAELTTYLANPPRLSLVASSVGEPADGEVDVTFTMQETTGTVETGAEPFNIQVGSTASAERPVYTTELAGGESRERTVTVTLSGTADEAVVLDWGAGEETYDV